MATSFVLLWPAWTSSRVSCNVTVSSQGTLVVRPDNAHLRLSKHIHQPTAHHPIRTARNQIVRILRPHHLHRVDRMGVARRGEWRLQHWEMLRPRVPQQDLARVRAAEDEVGVEGGECDGEYVGLSSHTNMISMPRTLYVMCVDCTWEWNTNSGRSNRWRFHTATMPSGSFSAAGFLLYEAQLNSGYYTRNRSALLQVALWVDTPSVTNRRRSQTYSCHIVRQRRRRRA